MNRAEAMTIEEGTRSEPITGDEAPSKSAQARVLCTKLLNETAARLGAQAGLVFAPTGDDRLLTVASTDNWRPGSAVDAPARNLALGALRADRPCSASVDVHGYEHEFVAVPCKVNGDTVAIVVTRRMAGRSLLSVDADATSLLVLGLAVERYMVLLTLDEKLAEAEAVRRQLDAYAVDLRSTYLAERERSRELASALGELTATYESTVRGLAIAVEAKDEYTGGHLQRVSRYGMAITAVVAPEHTHDPQFEYGFLLHDVGKLIVPDAVLMKNGPLGESEWTMMRNHPEAGKLILDEIPFLAGANEIVHCHHERWDGKGYPRGLRGEEIPLGARIFPLADVFDAMTTTRPYRKALSVQEARMELQREKGTQFWPDAVEAFSTIPADELEHVRASIPDQNR